MSRLSTCCADAARAGVDNFGGVLPGSGDDGRRRDRRRPKRGARDGTSTGTRRPRGDCGSTRASSSASCSIAGSTTRRLGARHGLDDSVEVYVARDTADAGHTHRRRRPRDRSRCASAAARPSIPRARRCPDGRPRDHAHDREPASSCPSSAVDDADRTGLATVVVPSRGALPTGLGAGHRVDVWTAQQVERGGFEPPAVLVVGRRGRRHPREPRAWSLRAASRSSCSCPREKVAALLQALAAGMRSTSCRRARAAD